MNKNEREEKKKEFQKLKVGDYVLATYGYDHEQEVRLFLIEYITGEDNPKEKKCYGLDLDYWDGKKKRYITSDYIEAVTQANFVRATGIRCPEYCLDEEESINLRRYNKRQKNIIKGTLAKNEKKVTFNEWLKIVDKAHRNEEETIINALFEAYPEYAERELPGPSITEEEFLKLLNR